MPALLVAVSCCAGLALVARWRNVLPDSVASHWTGREPDGFTSVTGVLVSVGVTGLVGVLLCLTALIGRLPALTSRSIAGLACGTAVFVIVLMVGVTAAQRGESFAAHTVLPVWAIIVAVLLGLAAGSLAVWSVPGSSADDPGPPVVGRLPASDAASGPAGAWTGRTTLRFGAFAVLAVVAVIVAAVAVLLDRWWILLIFVLVSVPAVGMSAVVRMRIDDDAVRISATFGLPRTVIPMGDVLRAEVVDVDAFREFGGWGVRVGRGASFSGVVGYVLRSGPGVMIVRRADASRPHRRDVVVIDDAETAAARINRALAAGR
ncbi:MAG: hypothetical protein QM658_07750 [Gordonia sp. (in: high G+C Gram-positive bacteria)]